MIESNGKTPDWWIEIATQDVEIVLRGFCILHNLQFSIIATSGFARLYTRYSQDFQRVRDFLDGYVSGRPIQRQVTMALTESEV